LAAESCKNSNMPIARQMKQARSEPTCMMRLHALQSMDKQASAPEINVS